MSKVFEIAFKLGGELTSSFKDAFGSAEGMMKTVGAAAAALGGTAALTAVVGQVMEMEDSLAKLSAQTGTYGQEMAALGDVAKNVFKKGHGESFDDVRNAVATVKQSFQNLDAGELERVTGNAMMLADTFDAEVNEVTRTASVMMKTFGDDSTKTMDLMAYAFQKGGNFSDELLDTMREYSPQFKALGYDSEAFTSILVAGAQAGAFNLDKIGDAAKESFLRVGDGSTGSRDALAALGMDFKQIENDINTGGDSATSAFAAVASAIALVQDPAEKSRLAVALMGGPIEDLGPEFQDFFANVSTDLVGFEGAMAKINEVRFDTVSAAIRGIGRTLLIDLVYPIGEAVLPYLNQFANFLQNNLSNAIEKAKSTFVTVVPVVLGIVSAIAVYKGTLVTVMAAQKVFNAVQKISIVLYNAHRAAMIAYAIYGGGLQGIIRAMAAAQQVLNVTMLANPFVAVAAAVIGLGVAFVAAYKMSDTFRDRVNGAFASVKSFVTNSANYIVTNATTMWNGLITSAKSLPDMLSSALSGSAIGKIVSGLFGDGKGIMDGLINSIKAGFSSLPGIISMVAPMMTTIGLSFLGVSGPIGWLIGAIVSIGGFLFRLAQTNDGVAASLGSAWQSVVTAFAPVIDVLKQGFADFASEVGPQLQQTMTVMAESIAALAPSFAQLGGTLAELAVLLMGVWADVGTTIATNVLPALLQAFQTVFPLVISVISTVIPIVIGLLASVIPIILQLVQMIIPLILSVIQMVFPMILSIIQSVLPIVATLITTVVSVILMLAQTVLPLVLSVVQMVFPIILSVIQAIIPIITMVLQTLVTIINGVIVPAINGILAVVQLVFPYVQMIIQNALAIVNGLIQTAMALLKGDWDGAWNAIKTTAETIMANIISFFQGINLFEVGKSIINGLIDGIASMGSAVVGAISGMIPEPIRGAASKLMGAFGGGKKGGNPIPEFAVGGIVDSATLAWVGEGGDTESIIPWNNSQRSKDLWMQTGQAIGMLSGSGAMENAQQQIAMQTFANENPAISSDQVTESINNNSSSNQIIVQYNPQYNVTGKDDLEDIKQYADQDKDDLEARIAKLQRDKERTSFG